ncbi:SCP2 sterol-binding domain-containing protein [Filobacillus milosensis]|uniref:SCP2 sterol-binding domain-containing protein n=1 Tax=Filobacillus milosensis TaxID=94137 RepID=A0A4Y8ISX4_9BACI|nr:SCP2 sterol-binding domain-containing protein [Filobacillus milosensis]TFB24030.1 SCP2 sterol-binding domain-containing protein [Filobacillus milosensis]
MSLEGKLKALGQKMNEDSSHYKGFHADFSFEIKDKEENWSVNFKGDQVELKNDLLNEPTCLLKMNEENFLKLLDGSLNATTAFMMGKIKADGELTKALKLQKILNEYQDN